MALPSTIIARFNGDSLNAQTDNSPISSIADLIGSVAGTQTGTARPTLVKNHPDFNGHSVMKLEAALQQYLDFGDNFDLLTGVTDFILVAKKNAGDMAFYSKVNTSFPAGRYSCMVYSPSGGSLLQGGLYAYDDGSQFGAPVINNTVDLGLTAADTVARVYRLQVDRPAGFLRFYINNVLQAQSAASAETLTSLDIAASFRLGMYVSGLELYFDGLIADLAVGRNMSAQDNADFYTALSSTYLATTTTTVTTIICDSMFQSQGTAVNETFAFKLATDTGADLARYTAFDAQTGSRDDYTTATLTDVINNGSTKKVFNLGIGGRRLNQFLPTASGEVGNKFTGVATKTILSNSGLNDLGAFRPLQEIKDNQLALKNFAIAQGADLMVTTLTNIGGAISANTPQVIDYVKVNGKLINEYFRAIHNANKIIPLDENIHFETPTDNLYFLPDQIHLSALGQALWYEIYKKVKAGTYTKPTIVTQSLPNATQNTPYNCPTITATGAVAAWEDISDLLPNGLTFNPTTQKYQGSPTEAGNFTLRPRAIMADGTFGYKEIPLTVNSSGGGGGVVLSDIDAQNYVNAGGIANTSYQNKVNQFCIELKSAGIWAKIKALYLFKSGTAIADKLNLKNSANTDAAFRLTFEGGWSYSAAGATPNGTTGYARTHLIPSIDLTATNLHIGFHTTTPGAGSNGVSQYYEMGAGNAETKILSLWSRRESGTAGFDNGNYNINRVTVNNSAGGDGFYVGTTRPTLNELYKNGTLQAQMNPTPLMQLINREIYIGGLNEDTGTIYKSFRTFTVASIGSGLTSSEVAAFNSAVDNFLSSAPPTNTAPVVNAGSDQTITLPATASLTGTASDDGLPTGSTLTKTWSKVSGAGTVNFANANALTTTAAFSAAGVYVLRLTANDGVLMTTDDVSITVNAATGGGNTAPTISAIADVTINEDNQTADIPFTIGDDGNISGLVVTGSSANPTLVPNNGANIVLSGTGANRTVKIIPAPNQFGTALITASVSDGSLTTTEQFQVTVNSVNDVPTISQIANQTTTTTTPINVTFDVGDIETPVANLQVTVTSNNQVLLPNGNLILSGSGATRGLQMTAANGQTGTAIVTQSVSDGVNTVTKTFTVTVNAAGTPVNTKRMLISWVRVNHQTNAAFNPQYYRLKRGTNIEVTNNVVVFNSITEIFYRDASGVFGVDYYWTVEAGNAYGYSAPFTPSFQILQNNG